MTFEYFNTDGLKKFIDGSEKAMCGWLQKFVEPKNDKNALIKVTWSPQFVLLEKRTNLNKLDNDKISVYEKLSTYEGAEHLSKPESVSSPTLASDLQRTCSSIYDHVKRVTNGTAKINRMVLYFKIDNLDRLWLLFITGIKVTIYTRQGQCILLPSTPIPNPIMTVPDNIKLFENEVITEKDSTKKINDYELISKKPKILKDDNGSNICPGCREMYDKNCM